MHKHDTLWERQKKPTLCFRPDELDRCSTYLPHWNHPDSGTAVHALVAEYHIDDIATGCGLAGKV